MKTLEQRQAELLDGQPWLGLYTDPHAKAESQRKADQNRAAVETLINAAGDPVKARQLWEKFPIKSEQRQERRRQFGQRLVIFGLLTREKLAEIEANYDNP